MNGIPVVEGGLLGLLAVVLRLIPRLLRPDAISWDSYYHLLAAEAIRSHRFRLPSRVHGCCFPDCYDYPPGFHWFLALFDRQMRDRVEPYISPILDGVLVLLGYSFAFQLARAFGLFGGSHTTFVPFFVGLFLASSPALLYIGQGPRAYNATPRTFGQVLFTGTMIAATYAWIIGSTLLFLLASFLGGCLLLSSKFGAQVLLFFSLILAFLLQSWIFVMLPWACALIALVLSRGHYWVVLKGQIGHLKLLRSLASTVYPLTASKNRLGPLLTLPIDLLRNPRRAFRTVLLDNSFVIVLIRHPHLVRLAVLAWLASEAGWKYTAVEIALWSWLGAGLLTFLITSFRPLLFLGEPERYLEHTVLPEFVLVVGACTAGGFSPGWLWTLLGYHFFMYGVYVVIFLRWSDAQAGIPSLKEETFSFLSSLPKKLHLLPIGEIYETAYRSGHSVFFPSGNHKVTDISLEEYTRIYRVPTVPNPDLGYVLEKYGLTGVFINKAMVCDIERQYSIKYDLSRLDRVFENEGYAVYQLPSP